MRVVFALCKTILWKANTVKRETSAISISLIFTAYYADEIEMGRIKIVGNKDGHVGADQCVGPYNWICI